MLLAKERYKISPWLQLMFSNEEVKILGMIFFPPQTRKVLSTCENVLQWKVNTKVNVKNTKPLDIVKNELGVFIYVTILVLKNSDQDIIKNVVSDNNKEIVRDMLQGEKISMIFPSKLSKCLHVQVLSFHKVHRIFLVSEHENIHEDCTYESYDSVFPVVFSKLERESHTYLALAVVPRKVLFQLVLQWIECIAEDDEGDDVDPMDPVQELQIWYSFHHQSSVSIDNQQKPYKDCR